MSEEKRRKAITDALSALDFWKDLTFSGSQSLEDGNEINDQIDDIIDRINFLDWKLSSYEWLDD